MQTVKRKSAIIGLCCFLVCMYLTTFQIINSWADSTSLYERKLEEAIEIALKNGYMYIPKTKTWGYKGKNSLLIVSKMVEGGSTNIIWFKNNKSPELIINRFGHKSKFFSQFSESKYQTSVQRVEGD